MPWEPPAAAFSATPSWEPPAEAFQKARTPEQVGAAMREKYPQAFANPDASQNWGDVAQKLTINDIYGGPIKGLIDTAKSLYNDFGGTLLAAFTPSAVEHVPKAIAAARRGDIPEFLARSANSVPFIGAIGESADADHPGRVVGNAAVAATMATTGGRALAAETGDALKDAATVSGKVAKAAIKAGGPQIAKGAGKIALGEAVGAAGGSPHLGVLLGAREGLGDVIQGGATAARGGSAALQDFLKQWRLADEAQPRIPLWKQGAPSAVEPAPPSAEPIPATQFPSGRKPGGIQNQTATTAPATPTAASNPLDAVASELGYKKTYEKLTAAQQAEVKIAVRAAEQEAARAAAPPPAPSNILDTPAKQQAAQALADDQNQVSTPQITSKGVNLFDREKPGMPKDVRPVPHDDLHNAVIDPKDVNLFARDYGMTETEALKFMEDKGVLVLDRAQSNKGIHDYYGSHENASNAALRKFGVKSMKDLTDSQVASWYNELLETQTTKADNQLLKAQRATAKKGTK